MKILVLGDRIEDRYTWGKGVRLCPESCAPVIHVQGASSTEGGAALVYEQVKALVEPSVCVKKLFGSISNKHRIFAGRTLICRIDNDSVFVMPKKEYSESIEEHLRTSDAVVVGDYGKGAIGADLAKDITTFCNRQGKPLFVDAKSDPEPYEGCFALFPNEDEHADLERESYQHVIRKLGARGCNVDGVHIPTDVQQVYDVTGAGDIFLAAFVVHYMTKNPPNMRDLHAGARYANKVAGESVKHLGTYIVKPEEINA